MKDTERLATVQYLQDLLNVENMPYLESVCALENNTLEIQYLWAHYGNALLLTPNGVFVTAKHCLDPPNWLLRVFDAKGRKYSIEEVCETSEEDDLAIGKINLQHHPEPVLFKMQTDEAAELNKRINHFSRWNGSLNIKHGELRSASTPCGVEWTDGEYRHFYDQASAQISIIGGDSGGPFVSKDGAFLGITSSGGKISASYAEADNVQRLIQKYVARLS